MITEQFFMQSKLVIVYSLNKEKISFSNDNLIVTGSDGVVKLQYSCYKIFALFVIGGVTITSGIIERAQKFGFCIVLFSANFKPYQTLNFNADGNVLLRQKQYTTPHSLHIARQITINKLQNQIEAIKKLRQKNDSTIDTINSHIASLHDAKDIATIMGFEGVAAKTYFNKIFKDIEWKGRQPRAKKDKINLLLDYGYTVLFNYVDALLGLFGFDVYKGNLHQVFFKRKSLTCDIVEPFRVVVDYATRKIINLKQIDDKAFCKSHDNRFWLSWENSQKIINIYIKEINNYKQAIFGFVQSYYRWFMKNATVVSTPMPIGKIVQNDID